MVLIAFEYSCIALAVFFPFSGCFDPKEDDDEPHLE
jgi:hypothetical protein